MKTKKFSVTGTGAWAWDGPWNVLFYEGGVDAGGQTAQIRIQSPDGSSVDMEAKPGRQITLATPASGVVITSLTGNAIVGEVTIGNGDIRDSSLLGTVDVVDGEKARTLAGGMFTASPVITAVNNPGVQLWNPGSSTKNVVLVQLSVQSNVAQGWNINFSNSIISGASTRFGNKLKGGPAPVAMVRHEDLAGVPLGTVYGGFIQANGFVMWPIKGAIILPPNSGLCVCGGATGTTLGANFEWFEEAI